MARIITVYSTERRAFQLTDMSYIRWFKISEGLARLGHQVDMAGARAGSWPWTANRTLGPNLRRIPIARADWSRYDVVKTAFHAGFLNLRKYRGGGHPFIIAKMGSVVGPCDMPGIYFYGERRERMYESQCRIHARARYVTLLTEPARALWRECYGPGAEILLVPGAVDREIPARGADPYPSLGRKRCLFAGNIYSKRSQPEANQALVDKLNALGRRLADHGFRLFLLGRGDVSRLDRTHVTYLGVVPYAKAWNYLAHADVGVIVSAGPFMHNNESTKVYHYLRAGLPVVSEAGFPNDDVIREAGLGFVVENGNLEQLAERVAAAAEPSWDVSGAVRYTTENHTWDHRVATYDRLIRQHFPD